MNWDILIGSSTGSLLVPLIAVNAFEDLKKAYTTSHQRDIFSNCPFFLHKTEEGFKASFNHFRILLQFMQGRKTFGESRNLKHLVVQGIPAHRLSANGFGQFQPIDNGDSPAALARNRRIELQLTNR